MAKPTNNVRVIVGEASGCCANDVSAVATARPSPRAGHADPMAIVRPEVTIEKIAMSVLLSIELSFVFRWHGLRLVPERRCRNINRRQNDEYVGLHHTCEQ